MVLCRRLKPAPGFINVFTQHSGQRMASVLGYVISRLRRCPASEANTLRKHAYLGRVLTRSLAMGTKPNF